MMAEYEYLFAMAVQQKLKQRVKCNVFVTVTPHDDLFVKIYREDEFEFKVYENNITEKLHNGLSSDYVAYNIAKQFKGFIMDRYFYHE